MQFGFALMQNSMLESLRWDDLRTFLAVARQGTLLAAAEDLGVNASTVHRRVGALEEALKAELFLRDPRGYALTDLGEALLPRAEEVEEAVLALRRTATGHDRTAQGPVVLTLPETLVSVVAPQIAAVRGQCPGLRPILRTDPRMLELGAEADIALRASRTPPLDAVGRKVGQVAWAVYGPEEVEEEIPWVIYTQGTGPVAPSDWRRRNYPEAAVLLEVSTVDAMHRVLRCTPAQGLLPCYLGDPDSCLKRRTPIIEEATTDLWLLVHADLRRSARVRALIELLEPRWAEVRELLMGREAAAPELR